jgi:hypothetical protein
VKIGIYVNIYIILRFAYYELQRVSFLLEEISNNIIEDENTYLTKPSVFLRGKSFKIKFFEYFVLPS